MVAVSFLIEMSLVDFGFVGRGTRTHLDKTENQNLIYNSNNAPWRYCKLQLLVERFVD